MSLLKRPEIRDPQIYINKDNQDVFDTLNGRVMASVPTGMVNDDMEGRLNAALACIYQLARQVRQLENKVSSFQRSNLRV